MAGLLVLTILWLGVIRPVQDGMVSSRERYDDAVIRLAGTQSEIETLQAAGRRRPLTGSLADAIRARADQAGFTLTTLDEQGSDRVHVTIQTARPAALSAWLASLERAGILIDAATLRDNGDKSVAADLVLKARAT